MKIKPSRPNIQPKTQQLANPQVTLSQEELEKLYQKEFQLQILQDKVNRSKPILETIYAKFKRKEQKLNKSIQHVSRKLRASSDMLIKYKQLYQDGLKIMKRNKLLQLYTGQTNYQNPFNDKENHLESQSSSKNEILIKMKQKYGKQQKKDQRANNITFIKQKYSQKQKKQEYPQLKLTKQQIYAKYKQKLGEDSQLIPRPTTLTAKQLSRKLLEQADLDLQRVASRSMHHRQQQPSSQVELTAVKQRYLLMQKEKLMKL